MQMKTRKVSIVRVCLMEIGLTMAEVAAFIYVIDYDSLIFSLYYKDYKYDFKKTSFVTSFIFHEDRLFKYITISQ